MALEWEDTHVMEKTALLRATGMALLLIGVSGCGGGRGESGREIVLRGQVLTTTVSLNRQRRQQPVPLPNAIIRTFHVGTGAELASDVAEDGQFTVRFPRPDTPLVELEAKGKSASQRDIVMRALVAAQSATVNIDPIETLTATALRGSGVSLAALTPAFISRVRSRLQQSQQVDPNQVDFTDPAQVQTVAQQAVGRTLVVTSNPMGASVFLGAETKQTSGMTPLLLEPPQSDSVVVRVELQKAALKTTLLKIASVLSQGMTAVHFNFQPRIIAVNQGQPLIVGNLVEIDGVNFGQLGETVRVQFGAFFVDGTIASVNAPDPQGDIPTEAMVRVPSNLSPGTVSVSVENAAFKSGAVSVTVQSISQGQFNLSSPVFNDGGAIPLLYTRLDGNVSPPLSWTDAPPGTRSFVITCLDTDANDFVHWVIYDIPAAVNSLPQGLPKVAEPFPPAKQGVNEFGQLGYDGPEPPLGDQRVHHYQFRIYALNAATLNLPAGASLTRVRQAMDGKTLGTASLVGTFRRF